VREPALARVRAERAGDRKTDGQTDRYTDAASPPLVLGPPASRSRVTEQSGWVRERAPAEEKKKVLPATPYEKKRERERERGREGERESDKGKKGEKEVSCIARTRITHRDKRDPRF